MASSSAPLVSVVLAVRDGGELLDAAVRSILGQTLTDLELLVVDDASRDGAVDRVRGLADPRARVIRRETSEGLAAALNAGLDAAKGAYVARMDADDIALPHRLELQVAALRSDPGLAIVGSGVAEISPDDALGAIHRVPGGRDVTRWRALFGTPFFHPSVLVDRSVLERHGLRYDPRFDVTQDYDLWSRLLDVADGDNNPEPLVLYRSHAGQASAVRADRQLELRREIALGRLARAAPALTSDERELAWLVGDARAVPAGKVTEAVAAFLDLLSAVDAGAAVERVAARSLARLAARSPRRGMVAANAALRLDPQLPLRAPRRRAAVVLARRRLEEVCAEWLPALRPTSTASTRPIRVTVVSPEPTPYRAPLFDRVAAHAEIDLTVLYAAQTVAGRTWEVELGHPARFLRGVGLPGAAKILRHDYPVTPGVERALAATEPDVVVVSGWSTYAAQAAIRWSRRHGVPYALIVESHDRDPRARWRRAVKGTIVPPIVRGAAAILATGTLVEESMQSRGATPDALFRFANTIDVERFTAEADALAPRRVALRDALGAAGDELLVLSVARLVEEKAHDVLIEAAAGVDGLRLVFVGDGPEREALGNLAVERGVAATFTGDVPWDRIVECYVAADVFALVSRHEPWGVVVNEAIACGLPLVLSDHVGAARDLLRDGENGLLVPADDVAALASALRRLVAERGALLSRFGARSRELAAAWGYGPSVDGFVAAVRRAAGRDQ